MEEIKSQEEMTKERLAKQLMDKLAKPQNLPYEDFAKLDIRAGTIIASEVVPKSKKLVKLEVSFGSLGTRTILAGIGASYNAETLTGMRIVAVLNLAKRTMMGIDSHGMLLAGCSEDGAVSIINPNTIVDGGEIG